MNDAAATDERQVLQPVSTWFMAAYLLLYLAVYTALFAPLLATIAVKIGHMSSGAGRAVDLGTVLAPGAFAALIAAPIFGAISDRTRGRFGRRKPWIFVGIAVMALGLLTMGQATTLFAIGMGWLLVQIGANAALAAGNALLPDLVPEHQRGKISALIGIALSLALLSGPYIARFTVQNDIAMFIVPWLLCPVAVLLLFSVFKDRPAKPSLPFGLSTLVETFWVSPVKHPDFAWAFLSRFLVFMGVAYFLSYQFIFISDHLSLPENEALELLALSQLLTTVVTVSCTLLSGWLSDYIGRRKPVVLFAGLLVALGLLVIGTSMTVTQFLIGAAIYGVGQGVYFAVDMALVAAVLPNPDDTAKDLGVFNVASAFPQTVAPVIAPMFLFIGSTAGSNLPAVFYAGAVFAVVGAFVVLPIRKTR